MRGKLKLFINPIPKALPLASPLIITFLYQLDPSNGSVELGSV